MPVQVIAQAADEPPRRRRPPHFCSSHPLFEVARAHCDRHGCKRKSAPCHASWELAIRDDERVVVEHDLPRELTIDPTYVDEIAVEKACKGAPVALTPVERAAAIQVLAGKGLSVSAIAARLHMCNRDLAAVLPRPSRRPRGQSGRSLELLHRSRPEVAR